MTDEDDYTTRVWFHGTTSTALPDILANGLRPQPSRPLVNRVEDHYRLTRGTIWNDPHLFTYSRERENDPYVYLSDDRADAEFYATAGPETLQDALRVAYRLTQQDSGEKGYLARAAEWAKTQTATFVGQPVVLQVNLEVPFAAHHHRVESVPAALITVLTPEHHAG